MSKVLRAGWMASLMWMAFAAAPISAQTRYGLTEAQVEAEAEVFDWRRERSRIIIHGALVTLAQNCAGNFGFTAPPEQPHTVMTGRIEAHLLIASLPDQRVDSWSRLIDKINNDRGEASMMRGADAVLAAIADPTSYDEAEALYVGSVAGLLREKLEACRTASRDQFIGRQYLSGSGTMQATPETLRAMFAASVEEVRRRNPNR